MATDFLDYSPNHYRKKYMAWTYNAIVERSRQPGLTMVERMVIDEILELHDMELPTSHRRLVRNDISDRLDGKPSVHVDQTLDVKPQSLLLNFVDTSQQVVEGQAAPLEIETGEASEAA